MKQLKSSMVLTVMFIFSVFFSGAAQNMAWLQKSPEERTKIELKKLREHLDFDKSQLKQTRQITLKKHEAITSLLSDDEENIENRRSELLAIWNGWDSGMQNILRTDQVKAYAELKVDFKEKLFKILENAKATKANKQERSDMNNAQRDSESLDEIDDPIEDAGDDDIGSDR